ncbi:MAG: hypothetical protein RL557_816 [archaeon]|jgi:hypothetical protein
MANEIYHRLRIYAPPNESDKSVLSSHTDLVYVFLDSCEKTMKTGRILKKPLNEILDDEDFIEVNSQCEIVKKQK